MGQDSGIGGGSNTSVVHIMFSRPGKQTQNRLFFETEQDSRELRLGVKTCLFSREGVLFGILLGVVFKLINFTKCSPLSHYCSHQSH